MNTVKRMLAVAFIGMVVGCIGTSPLLSQNPEERKRAVSEISDDKQLFFIAMNLHVGIQGEWPELYSVTHIRKGEYPDDVRVAAVERLKNMDYLLMCASWNDGDLYVDPGYEQGRFEYKGKTYYCDRDGLRQIVSPGNEVRSAAINRLVDFATFKDASNLLDANAEKRLFPQTPKGDGNVFIDHYGHVRSGNPLDTAFLSALKRLKQPNAAVTFLYNAAEGGQSLTEGSFAYAMDHLDGISSKVATSLFRRIFMQNHNRNTKNEWLLILFRYIDNPESDIAVAALRHATPEQEAAVVSKIKSPTTAEKLLAARVVCKTDQQLALMKMLPEKKMVELILADIEHHDVYKWNKGDLRPLSLGIGALSSVKDIESVKVIASAVLSKIADYRKDCSNSWTMSWDETDEGKVKWLMGRLPKLPDEALGELICLDDASWKYFADSVTASVAYNVLTQGKAKSAELEETLIKKLPAENIDMKVYDGVKTEAGRKAVLAAMPEELKKSALESAERAFKSIMEKAKAAAAETFELDGFYLGMSMDDAKMLMMHHFPDVEITEEKDKNGEYKLDASCQDTSFCWADKERKVYQFNFGKQMLKKWYEYNAARTMDWAKAFSRERNIEMKLDFLERSDDVYLPNAMLQMEPHHVSLHQEIWTYKDGMKNYRITYFGERKFGGNGIMIKAAAHDKYMYISAPEGTLRAKVEND